MHSWAVGFELKYSQNLLLWIPQKFAHLRYSNENNAGNVRIKKKDKTGPNET